MSEASQSQQPGMWTETELPRQPQPLPSEPEPPRPPRLQPVNRNQLLWHAVDEIGRASCRERVSLNV